LYRIDFGELSGPFGHEFLYSWYVYRYNLV